MKIYTKINQRSNIPRFSSFRLCCIIVLYGAVSLQDYPRGFKYQMDYWCFTPLWTVSCISLWSVLLVEYFEQYFSYMYIIVDCAIGRVLWTIFQLYVYHCALCYWSSTLNNFSVICISLWSVLLVEYFEQYFSYMYIALWSVLLVEYFKQYFSYMYIIVNCAIGRVL
jgi:hypothetical protein